MQTEPKDCKHRGRSWLVIIQPFLKRILVFAELLIFLSSMGRFIDGRSATTSPKALSHKDALAISPDPLSKWAGVR